MVVSLAKLVKFTTCPLPRAESATKANSEFVKTTKTCILFAVRNSQNAKKRCQCLYAL